jgi:hypothetical protein
VADEKNVTDFHEGDSIEFRYPGYVRKVTAASVHVSLDDLDSASDVPVPPSRPPFLTKW